MLSYDISQINLSGDNKKRVCIAYSLCLKICPFRLQKKKSKPLIPIEFHIKGLSGNSLVICA